MAEQNEDLNEGKGCGQDEGQFYITERFISSIGAVDTSAVQFSMYCARYDESGNGRILITPFSKETLDSTLSTGVVNDLGNIISGQELLIQLGDLYSEINDAPMAQKPNMIARWCMKYIQPYNIHDVLVTVRDYKLFKAAKDLPTDTNQSDDPMAQLLATDEPRPNSAELLNQCLQKCCDTASFYMDDFIHDLNIIANAIQLFSALCTLYFDKDDTLAKQLYHPESDDDEGVPAFGLANNRVKVNAHSLRWLADLFPKLAYTIQYDQKSQTIGIAHVQDSVFDIAWNALAELTTATFGKQPYSKATAIKRCDICGHYFIRKYPNQRYCGSAECEKIRNRRKALRYKHGDY